MDYKKTLNMPQTKFDMRGNLLQKEPYYRKQWLDNDIYNKILVSNDHTNQFIVHDGPPYANGNLHVGHALNKILKDIIVRYKSMSGFYSPYIPGWDTHGLPIEHKMLTEMKISKDELDPYILRKKAATYALKQVEIQKKQFQLLQLQSDMKDFYVTLRPEYEVAQIRLFQKMWNDGLVYKGLKPVYWSPSSQSALAEAEVEYANIDSPSIYVAFSVTKGNSVVPKGSNLIIWTTTPWTLLANSAVAVSEQFEYSLIEHDSQKYVIATELIEKVLKIFKWDTYKVLESFDHSMLTNLEYESPMNKNISPVVIGHHVTLESGTGLVHIAPLFGEDDFLIGKKNKLNMIMHIEDNGTMNKHGLEFQGQFYLKANPIIIEKLTQSKNMIYHTVMNHSFPHDWRTNQPIMYRGTPQWFVSTEKIKPQILSALDDVNFYTSWAKKRLTLMMQHRDDWTISRQRSWGVPIVAFYNKDKEIVLNDEIFEHVISLFKQNGSDVWYKLSTDELLPDKYRDQGFTHEKDIMDVWFDSGISWLGANIPETSAPYDLYLEGSDQYRGWFNSSLINAVAYMGKSPYKNLVSHGFVLDGKGQKMSKSKGNVVDPLTMVKEYGADILRLWAANSEYSSDVTISNDIMKQNVEIYRNIRNKLKFMLGNINGFVYKPVKYEGIHLYIHNKLLELQKNVHEAYDNFNFILVVKNINNYLLELSSFYLSVTKDVLYIDLEDAPEALMIKSNLFEITNFILKALAPILPTTCEDAFEHFSIENKEISIHLSKYDKFDAYNEELNEKWSEFFIFRDKVNLLIENSIKSKEINRSNEAVIFVNEPSKWIQDLNLNMLLMVADIKFSDVEKVEKIDGSKCERCWNHFYNENMVNDICQRCDIVVKAKGMED